jgi:tetratricopeptide (TPR) repeat protein
LPLLRASGEQKEEAEVLYSIGNAYSDLDNKQQALNYFEQALFLFRVMGYQKAEANMLNAIAFIHSQKYSDCTLVMTYFLFGSH